MHLLFKKTSLIFYLTSIFVVTQVTAQESFFNLLPEDSIIHVDLVTDLKKLVKGKKNPSYQNATFKFVDGPMAGKSYEIEVKPRGNMRRQICRYPPIKMKFSKNDLAFNKIKWVGVCRDNKFMKDKIQSEYLAYRLYNEVTEYSFRVRLLQVSFKAPKVNKTSLVAFGFIIEPVGELAARVEASPFAPRKVNEDLLCEQHYPMFTVFQYLIGNTDWHMPNQHNLKLLRSKKLQAIIPIPYDFDYSGLVDAPYAVPHTSVPIKNVRERYNKSTCLTEEKCQSICEEFLAQKDDIYASIDKMQHLDNREKKRMKGYLNDGYDVLEKGSWAKRVFVKDCGN